MRRPNRKRSRGAKKHAGTTRRWARDGGGATDRVRFVATFQRLIGEIFRFNGRLLDVAASLSGDLGITPTHWQTIAVIRNEPLTVAEISRRVGLRRQSVAHTVTQLRSRQLVELVVNPRHRRARLVRLTPRGRTLMRSLLRRQATLTARFTRSLALSAADIERQIAALQRMRHNAEGADVPPPTEP